MAGRGSYAKGVARREAILRTALDVIARRGFGGTTLRDIADAVGLTQAGVLHYFGSKEDLLTEVLRRRDELDSARFAAADDVTRAWRETVRHNTRVPGLVELFSRLGAEATDATHPAHEFFDARYAAARRTTAEGVRRLQREGRLGHQLDADRLAVLVVALADGLQVQWRYDPTVDMTAHLDDLWRLLGVAADEGEGDDSAEAG